MSTNSLRDPREYVASWMEFNKVRVSASGGLVGQYGTPSFSTMLLDHYEEIKVANVKLRQAHFESAAPGAPKLLKPISKVLLECAWQDYPAKRKEEAKKQLIERVVVYKGPNDELAKWLQAVTGAVSDVDLAVMQHFIWQVKRKMLDLPVVYHICPIFFGKQNGGKTTSIQKLINFAQDVVLELEPDEATDSRAKAGFTDNYICFFDEMANMARVEMESLKRLITTRQLSYRPLHTNEVRTVPQNCSFIGASNKSLQEVVYDPTGLRRFYEFTCLDRVDFDGINNIDYTALWSSIDPTLERGYTEPFLANMTEHQTERITEDEVSQFIRELGVNDAGPKKEITASALYGAYIHWRAITGYSSRPALVANTFGARLASHKITKRIRKIDGYQKTVYDVNAASKVFDTQLIAIKGGVS